MTTEKLDISNFERAIARLEEAIAEYEQDTTRTVVRDGLIQRFEFTYEIAHKTLKRFLEFASPSPEQYDKMVFQDLIRSANEQDLTGLIGDVTGTCAPRPAIPTMRRLRWKCWPVSLSSWKRPATCATG